ncbi:hypothetical protein GBAR_LOCUS22063 [Geodia barretti]|uniref:Uncharacterized protein n=1 Tax=Geodia barretti TaxID=519541 RepID=A0AA35WZF6_GEOBA|nr:hypothetical protein GBAR_LOCUS22063 [Geodia barretti]
MSLKVVWIGSLILSLSLVLACGGAAPAEPQVIEREVVKEVVVEKEVPKEVVVEKEVQVEREVEVTREVLVVATPVPPVEAAVRSGAPTGTLTVSLQNLGAQTTDPILQGRAGHAQYQAPIYDALLGFNYESQYGGVGPGVAHEWGNRSRTEAVGPSISMRTWSVPQR